MITVYHLGISQSDRIVWLMEELDLPYKLEWYDRGADGLAPESYRALHPVGTAPIIRDGDRVLGESVAIVEYINQRYGNGELSPAVDDDNYADYWYWMQFNGNVMGIFFAKRALATAGAVEESDSPILTMIRRREDAYYQDLELRLAKVPYLAGELFTGADIMAMFSLTTLPHFGGRSIDDLPHVQDYVDRVSQRPAYIKAMSIAGPNAKKPNQ